MRTEFENRLLHFSTRNINDSTEENILNSYNKEYGKNVTRLTEAEYSVLCSRVNILISEMTKGEQDAIANFAMKNQFEHISKVIINDRGFFFMLFIYLMSRLKEVSLKN